MVHSMDACSGKWRDDPVRAAIEKKQNRENAASRQAASAAHVAALLKAKMEGLEGRSKSTGLSSIEPEPSAIGSDADYRKQLDAQRKRLMDGAGSESDSSESSVFDPWANKRVKREEKRERKEKEKAEKRERKSETPPNLERAETNHTEPQTRNHTFGRPAKSLKPCATSLHTDGLACALIPPFVHASLTQGPPCHACPW